ncbi:myosin-IIIb-like isoform X1 [Tachypleus tridentatus]|uniref:myosin-IIIb-like isoform X1 n=1 Tax=Tachypleus tridentatus TaxID=6853 RepID=UPI003FD426D0
MTVVEGSREVYYSSLSQNINFLSLPDPTDVFDLQHVIGEGTYGEVFAARNNLNERMVAVKIMENIADSVEEIEEEYLVLRDLCLHPNIPMFNGLYLKPGTQREEDQLWFVMELCSGGSVTDLVQSLIKRGKRLPELIITFILRETMDALAYLHRNHCMHRDVKGHNILLTEDANVKLVDFGVSSHLKDTMGKRNTSVGTPYWMAPEVVACEQQLDYSYDVRCDVWSVGITAIELAEGEPPLADVHPMRALFQIPRNPPPKLKKELEWSEIFNDFISECLIKDFEERPMVSELLRHPFIEQVPVKPTEIQLQLKEIMCKQKELGYCKRPPEVTTKHGQLKTDRKSRPQPIMMDDLAGLENLTEDIIVEQLAKRYGQNQIYTYIGDILLAVNPFQDVPLYTDKISLVYRNHAKADNAPHIFAIADSAYHSMLHQRQNQCVVISGESGAGKTESANFLLKQMVSLGMAPNRNLEEKILQVNPIMEAFGNAKTGINDNSSRFGKYLDLTFTQLGKVTGAKLSVYLLEQSRVVRQAVGERNFHIFYYLFDGLESEGKTSDYYLNHSERHQHRYIQEFSSNSSCRERNVKTFNNIKQGFQLLGFCLKEIDTIYCILAAVLHLGDIAVREVEDEHNSNKSLVRNKEKAHIVAELLGVDTNCLTNALTTTTMVMRGETITRPNSVQEAECTRDAMAKALYGRLFDWIVNQINRLLSLGHIVYGEQLSVGLLDIFGFEDFKENSFEQLCINIANEQIQYYFNQHIFTWEQQEYRSEGIDIDLVNYSDNRPVLDMFLEKPMGLLCLLDEESHFPNATDQSLTEKFHNNVKSRYYIRPKSNALQFHIQHYAGKVTYNAHNFLQKNRNFLPPKIIHLLRQSSLIIIQTLFRMPLTKTGHLFNPEASCTVQKPLLKDNIMSKYNTHGLISQTRAQQTVATYFRYSLMDLLNKMVSGVPHFVRCIKPNDEKLPAHFNLKKVVQQLRYTGILETIHIRQQGYSHRLTFAEFLRRYCFLAFGFDERVVVSRENCRLLLLRLKMDGWALGKTKVFLKYYHVEYLSHIYEQQIRKIIVVQAAARRWLAIQKAKRERWQVAKSVLILQKYARGWLARKNRNLETSKPLSIPSDGPQIPPWRRDTSPGPDDDVRSESPASDTHSCTPDEAACTIQKYVRSYLTRRKIQLLIAERKKQLEEGQQIEEDRAAVKIQATWRNWHENSNVSERIQLARARHASQLVHMSQQVQQYNQDVQKHLRRNRPPTSPEVIQPVPGHFILPHQLDSRPKTSVNDRPHKLPLLLNWHEENSGCKSPAQRTDDEIETPSSLSDGYPDDLTQFYSSSNDEQSEIISSDEPWDAPLRNFEAKIKPNITKQVTELDVKGMVRNSLKSQLWENKERENQLLGKWMGLLTQSTGDKGRNESQSPPPKQLCPALESDTSIEARNGKRPTMLEIESWWQKGEELKSRKENEALPTASPKSPVQLCAVPQQTYNLPLPISQSNANYQGPIHIHSMIPPDCVLDKTGERRDSSTGPYDFRKLLRKTAHAPTETLRRCKGLSSNLCKEF